MPWVNKASNGSIAFAGKLPVIFIAVAVISSTLMMGFEIIPTVANGGWYVPNGLLLLAPSAFFIMLRALQSHHRYGKTTDATAVPAR